MDLTEAAARISGMDLPAWFRRTVGTRCVRVVTTRLGPRCPGRTASDFEALFRAHWPSAHRAASSSSTMRPPPRTSPRRPSSPPIRNLDRFDRRRPFAPWLHRIVVNRAIDWARARALRPRRPGSPSAGRAPAVSSDLLEELRGLSPEHRAVIVLRYLLEYTPGEIGKLLDLPRGTVNSRLRRGLDQLQETLQ